MNIPVFFYNEQRTADAYTAYLAVLTQQHLDPTLEENPEWLGLRDYAYSKFEAEYVRSGGES